MTALPVTGSGEEDVGEDGGEEVVELLLQAARAAPRGTLSPTWPARRRKSRRGSRGVYRIGGLPLGSLTCSPPRRRLPAESNCSRPCVAGHHCTDAPPLHGELF